MQKILLPFICGIFLLAGNLYSAPQAATQEESGAFLSEFRKYASEVEYIPIQMIAFRYSSVYWDSHFISSSESESFHEFLDFALTTKAEEWEACVHYLEQASPKERCLIFLILHGSGDPKYLSVIARYVNDSEPVCPPYSRWESPKRNESEGRTFTPGRKEALYSRRDFGKMEAVGTMVSFLHPEKGDLCVGSFARVILVRWTRNPLRVRELLKLDEKVPLSVPDEEFCKDEPRQLLFWSNKYQMQVECSRDRDYDRATVKFLEQVETLPMIFQFYVLVKCGLYIQVPSTVEDGPKIILYTSRDYPFPAAIRQELVWEATQEKNYNDRWIQWFQQFPREQIQAVLLAENPDEISTEFSSCDIPEEYQKRYQTHSPYPLLRKMVIKNRSLLLPPEAEDEVSIFTEEDTKGGYPAEFQQDRIPLKDTPVMMKELQSLLFVEKIRSIAEKMDVFPVDLIARRGPLCFHTYGTNSPEICIRTELGIEDFRVFCEFCCLALHTSKEDIDSCLEALPFESPKVRALLLTTLYIYTRTWSDELLKTDDDFDLRVSASLSWSWLEMNIGCLCLDFKNKNPIPRETYLRYKTILQDYSSCFDAAFEKTDGNVEWEMEKSKNLFLQRGFSVTSLKTFAERQVFCEKIWKENPAEALPLISDLLYLYYWGDTFQISPSGTGPRHGNASTAPKTVGQIATQLLESWEPVELDEEGRLRRRDEND